MKIEKNKNKFRFLAFFLFAIVFFFSNFLVTYAIVISPPKQMAVVKFGDIEKVSLFVENNEDNNKIFVPSVDAFTIDSETGAAIFGQSDVAFNWIKSSPESLVLAPGESGTFTFSIFIPEDADSGGHYLGLFASEQKGEGQVAFSSRVGSLLFLYTEGDIREDLVKVDFSTNKKVLFFGPLEVNLNMKNVGNIHLIPTGELGFVKGSEQFKKIDLNENKRKVLPGDFWSAGYLVEKFDWKKFGKIKIVLKNIYGVSGKTMLDSVEVWYLPWPILFVCGVLILAVGVGVFLIKKFFIKSK